MSKTHETIRIIRGKVYCCLDTGCDDFDRAEQNRLLVSQGVYTIGYLVVEKALAGLSLKRRLPTWIPQGELPVVGKKDWTQFGGEPIGMYEALEPGENLTDGEGDVV